MSRRTSARRMRYCSTACASAAFSSVAATMPTRRAGVAPMRMMWNWTSLVLGAGGRFGLRELIAWDAVATLPAFSNRFWGATGDHFKRLLHPLARHFRRDSDAAERHLPVRLDLKR